LGERLHRLGDGPRCDGSPGGGARERSGRAGDDGVLIRRRLACGLRLRRRAPRRLAGAAPPRLRALAALASAIVDHVPAFAARALSVGPPSVNAIGMRALTLGVRPLALFATDVAPLKLAMPTLVAVGPAPSEVTALGRPTAACLGPARGSGHRALSSLALGARLPLATSLICLGPLPVSL
jgi:hypothetical protein